MIEMEDQTNDVHEAGIPVLDYKTYTDRVFFLPSKDGDKDVMITGKLDIPESRRPVVEQALYQFSNLLNSKCFLINVSGAGPLDHRAGLPAAGRRGRRGGGGAHLPPVAPPTTGPPTVHPHPGEPAGVLCSRQGLFCVAADGGAAREAGVLHRHHAHPLPGAHGAVRGGQEPQADAAQVRGEGRGHGRRRGGQRGGAGLLQSLVGWWAQPVQASRVEAGPRNMTRIGYRGVGGVCAEETAGRRTHR